MPLPVRRSVAAGTAVACLALSLGFNASAQADPAPQARLSSSMVGDLASATGLPMPVMVHGTDLAAARSAAAATGMSEVTSFDRIGVVVALATPAQVDAARTQPGVTYLEGNRPIEMSTTSSHVATRGLEARQTLVGANGSALDGTGVSVAVIDSGVDPTHPAFADADGNTRVVRSLKSLCLVESDPGSDCVVDVPTSVDTDTLSLGGHGTHVSGIAIGSPVVLTDGTGTAAGAAPGAKLVSISTGAVLFIIGADSALNWVLENHAAPCGAGVSGVDCPPIKVTNNSYGPSGGGAFDPESATVKLQRALAADGVVTVWAAGNDGGDGTTSLTNPPSQDPTGGILGVASYNDLGTGTRAGTVSDFSSRGDSSHPSTWPDLAAPGENIVSSCRPYLVICSTGTTPQNGPGPLDLGTYNTISGTSMAAPHVAGIVAQLFQADPTATPAEIEAVLVGTALPFTDGAGYTRVGDRNTSYDKGAGLVDVVRAATALGATAG